VKSFGGIPLKKFKCRKNNSIKKLDGFYLEDLWVLNHNIGEYKGLCHFNAICIISFILDKTYVDEQSFSCFASNFLESHRVGELMGLCLEFITLN